MDYVHRTEGKRSRVVNADGGGTAVALGALESEGIVDIWHIDQWTEKSPFAMIDLASRGWWPEDIHTPNSRLLPPVNEWRPCPACGGDSGARGLTMPPSCSSCKKAFPSGLVLPLRREPTNGLQEIGLVGFEGMTSFGDILLDRFREKDPTGGNVITDGDFKIAQSGQGHYGMAQQYLLRALRSVRQIPVKTVVWTALELRSDDDGKPLYGPAGPGKKLTTLGIPCFTAVLHLEAVAKKDPSGRAMKDKDGVEILDRRLFLAPHYPSDAPSNRFVAKVSVPRGGTMPLSIDASMETFFKELGRARAEAQAALKTRIEKEKE